MLVDVLIEDPRWNAVGLDALSQVAAKAVLAHVDLQLDGVEISLIGCDDNRIAALNSDFRGKSQPTNVLSWPSEERGAAEAGGSPNPPNDPELGDIAISYDTCAQEAADSGKEITDHTTHLIVHATLHLLGYDHENDADATLMERIEVEVLGKMGLDNPYLD